MINDEQGAVGSSDIRGPFASTGQSSSHLQALSGHIRAITVLRLDECPLEPSRLFCDVLLPRLALACTADCARVR